MTKVLIVEDDAAVRRLVAQVLEMDGYEVLEASDVPEMDAGLAASPDLVILDVGLPSASGFDLLGPLRADRAIPVILLTGRSGEADRIQGLDLGADDYVAKPFSPAELAARVRSVLRRAQPHQPSAGVVDLGPLQVDLHARIVRLDGAEVPLTRLEFDLLAHLVRHPNRTFSRNELLATVWGSSAEWQDPATVTEHVRRIRLKIEGDGSGSRWFRTIRGVGYLFDSSGEAAETAQEALAG